MTAVAVLPTMVAVPVMLRPVVEYETLLPTWAHEA
jgi:hypothetical protein